MSASTRQDFGDFASFVRSFSLGGVLEDAEKVALIRLAHAQFLALLTVGGELMADSGSARGPFSMSYGEDGRKYLGEVISDCSEFMMAVLLGMYRSAGGTLRSAIESYLKAFVAAQHPMILQRTSVPEVFRDAAGAEFFSTTVGQGVLSELKVVYTDLNSYVHTVTPNQMFGALAVGSFPRWSDKTARLITLFVRVARLFLYGMIGTRRDLYDLFDHRNKVVANRAMTRVQRRSAMGVDD